MRVQTVRATAALGLVALAGSCGGSDASGSKPRGDALYAVFTSVDSPEGATTYLGLTDTLEGSASLDTKQALEVPGASRFYAPEAGGFFALGSNEDLSITRYDIDDDDRINETGKISFAGLGVTRLHFRNVFVSATKAYYIDHTQGQIIVWNPHDLSIDRSIPLPEEIVDGYEGYTTVLPYHRFPVVKDRLFIPVAWYNYDTGTARDVTGLVVYDTSKDEVASYTETDRCAAANELAFDDNGDVYYGTGVNYPFYSNAGDAEARAESRPGCILRIRAGEVSFDKDYFVRLTDMVGGRTAMGLADGAVPGVGYVQVLNEDALPWSSISDEDTFWESSEWQWWKIELRTGKAELDPEIPSSAPYMTSYQVDGRRYVSRQTGEGESRLFELSADGAHKPAFQTVGSIRGVARVR
jgi:hypothetical protein